ncbi:MAG: N-succinylarginine dihydrolase [Planctomycetota bacterium]
MSSQSAEPATEFHEINFDGLVGPTHNYAGLAPGNLHSTANAKSVSYPKRAALQGIAKMRRLMDMGLPQAVLPPQERPDILALRRLGFTGTDEDVLKRAGHESPALLSACCSASGMWSANAATFSPAPDSDDACAHITPANLNSLFHRQLEVEFVERLMWSAFGEGSAVRVHASLPGNAALADEGAANHVRLCADHGEPGVQLFAFGRFGIPSAEAAAAPSPSRFTARQTREACEALARLHRLDPDRVFFAQQSPRAIDAGIFHNDVICVGHRNVLLYHEHAYVETQPVVDGLRQRLASLPGSPELIEIRISDDDLPLDAAASSYLFNSQLIDDPGNTGSMRLVAPEACREHPQASAAVRRILAGDNPVDRVDFVDVSQSLRNGGGPACLRLRMVLSETQIDRIRPRLIATDDLLAEIERWVGRHYRDELHPADLADPALARESIAALDELSAILDIRGVYFFQRRSD